MMEKKIISRETFDFITNVVCTMRVFDINDVIISSSLVKAFDDKKTKLLWHGCNVPEIIGEIAFTEASTLISKLNLASAGVDEYAFELSVDGTYVKSITAKGKGGKHVIMCAKPNVLEINKTSTIKWNSENLYTININEVAVDQLKRTSNAYKSDNITLTNVADKLGYVLKSTDGSMYEQVSDIIIINNTADSNIAIKYIYPLKPLLTLIMNSATGKIEILEKGILRALVNDLTIYAFPNVTTTKT